MRRSRPRVPVKPARALPSSPRKSSRWPARPPRPPTRSRADRRRPEGRGRCHRRHRRREIDEARLLRSGFATSNPFTATMSPLRRVGISSPRRSAQGRTRPCRCKSQPPRSLRYPEGVRQFRSAAPARRRTVDVAAVDDLAGSPTELSRTSSGSDCSGRRSGIAAVRGPEAPARPPARRCTRRLARPLRSAEGRHEALTRLGSGRSLEELRGEVLCLARAWKA